MKHLSTLYEHLRVTYDCKKEKEKGHPDGRDNRTGEQETGLEGWEVMGHGLAEVWQQFRDTDVNHRSFIR